MTLSLLPTGIGLLEGGVDGLIRQNDTNNGRVEIHKEYSTYYEAALFVGGAVMGMMDVHPDIFEPLVYGGGALLASKGGQWAMQQAAPATTTTTTSTSTSGGGPGQPFRATPANRNGNAINYGGDRTERVGIL